MNNDTIRILAFAGSLRRESYNRKLISATVELAPDGMHVDTFDLGSIPLYNADIDEDGARPAGVEQFKQAVAQADGLLISTPEYNHSVSGVLQNAIDWASRPGLKSVLKDKPCGIMGASRGVFGAARAQQQLKLVLLATLAPVMPHNGVAVGNAPDKFDESGALVHAATREFVADYLRQFRTWVRRLNTDALTRS